MNTDPKSEDILQIDLTPYNYSWNNPINISDPDGECPMCLGFAIGFLIDVVFQAVEISLDDSKTIDDFSLKRAAVSGLAGATGVGLASKLKNVSTITRFAVEVSTDASFSATTQYLENGRVDLTDVLLDAAGSQTIGRVVGDFSESNFLNSRKGKNLQEQINKQKNIERGKSNTTPSRKADVKTAKNKLTTAAAVKGIASSTASSGITSTLANSLVDYLSNISKGKKRKKPKDERSYNVKKRDNTRVRNNRKDE